MLQATTAVTVRCSSSIVFFNYTATTEIYTLSLHDALPILLRSQLEPAAGHQERARNPRRCEPQYPLAGIKRRAHLSIEVLVSHPFRSPVS